MKKQEYYKVVSIRNGKLFSFTEKDLPTELKTQYYVHRPVSANLGGLLVFSSLEAAINCWAFYHDRRIYRCTVRDEVYLPKFRAGFWRNETFAFVWENSATLDNPASDMTRWPPSTRAFKTITLRERIY